MKNAMEIQNLRSFVHELDNPWSVPPLNF